MYTARVVVWERTQNRCGNAPKN